MQKIRLILSVVLIALVLVFVLQNMTVVEVKFLFWSLSVPRSLLIFVTLLLGVIIGWFIAGTLRKSRL